MRLKGVIQGASLPHPLSLLPPVIKAEPRSQMRLETRLAVPTVTLHAGWVVKVLANLTSRGLRLFCVIRISCKLACNNYQVLSLLESTLVFIVKKRKLSAVAQHLPHGRARSTSRSHHMHPNYSTTKLLSQKSRA